jgi:hypothetical protein
VGQPGKELWDNGTVNQWQLGSTAKLRDPGEV